MDSVFEVLIVDDELLARTRIEKILVESDYAINISHASTGKEAISKLSAHRFDIVFLDIQMTDMTGFDVLKKTNTEVRPIIIFVTAFDNFAVKAFEYQALDFLLKPYKKERFLEALRRGIMQIQEGSQGDFTSKISHLLKYLENETDAVSPNYLQKIVLKLKNRYYFIKVSDIKYITSSAYYAEIFMLNDTKHVYRISMTDLIKRLDPQYFIRVNRSSIINLEEIREVISEGSGDFSVKMNDNKTFALTKIYKKDFLSKVSIK